MDKKEYKTPSLTVDALIFATGDILLIKRKNPPYGWALPGGFVDYGESVEDAVVREVKEETNLEPSKDVQQFKVYSDPDRDPRCHVVSVVFRFNPKNVDDFKAGDDAKELKWFNLKNLPEMAFDHKKIVEDYMKETCEHKWRKNYMPGECLNGCGEVWDRDKHPRNLRFQP